MGLRPTCGVRIDGKRICGHPAVALVTTGCIHEHINIDFPVCSVCLFYTQCGKMTCTPCHELDMPVPDILISWTAIEA